MAAEQQTNITIGVNAQPFTDGLKTASGAAQQFESQIDKLSTTTQRTSQQITMTAASFQKLVTSLDPAARSAQNYAAAQLKIQQAVASGLTSQEQANKLLDLAAQKYNVVYKAEEDATKSIQQQTEAYKQFGNVLGPILQKTQQLVEVEKALNAEVKAGNITQAQATQLLTTAKQYGGAAAPQVPGTGPATGPAPNVPPVPNVPTSSPTDAVSKIKLTSQQLFIFEAQIRQFVDQVISSGGVFRPLIQQAPQAVDSLGGVSKALALLRNNAASIVGFGGIAAIVVSLGLIAVAAEKSQRAINDLAISLQKYGGNFAANAATVNAAAKELASTTSLTTAESREAILKLAETPGFKMTKENMVEVTKQLHDLAASFGETLPQAAADFKNTFADPVAAALKYAEQNIDGFNQSFVETVRTIQQQSGQAAAGAAVWNKLSAAVKDTGEKGTALQTAWKHLIEALTATGNSATGANQGIGITLVNGVTALINATTKLIPLINDVGAAIAKVSDGMSKLGISTNAQSALFVAAFVQMLSPVRNLELALLKIVAIKIPSWFASLASGAVTGAAEGAAARAAAPVAGRAATAVGGAVVGAAETVGASVAFAALGGAAGVAALAVVVLAAAAGSIYLFIQEQAARAAFQAQAEAAGYQQYRASAYEQPRYLNTRTGEDLSTEQMQQKLLGQTLADSFTTRLSEWFARQIPGSLGGRGTILEQEAAKPQPGTAILKPLSEIPAAGQKYAPLFAAAEQQYGLPAGILAAIASHETGGTFDPSLVNKDSGAAGLMQILQSSGERPGYGITPLTAAERHDPAKSIDFAAQYLAKVAAAHGGDLSAAVKQYAGGEGKAAYLLDPDVAKKYVQKAPEEAKKPEEPKAPVQPLTTEQEVQAILSGTSKFAPEAMAGGQARTTEQLKALTQAYIDHIEKVKEAAKAEGVDGTAIEALNKSEEEARAKLEGLKTPYERTIQAQQEQLKVTEELNPAMQKVTEALTAYENAQRAAGKPILQTEEDAIKRGVLTELAAQYKALIATADQEVAAQDKVAAAWDKGAIAVDHATNYQRAWQQVVGASTTATAAQAAAVELLAADYDKVSQKQKEIQVNQMLRQTEGQSKLLDVQAAHLTGTATEQAQATAVQQAKNTLDDLGLSPDNPKYQKFIESQKNLAVKTVDVDREKAAWSEVEQSATSAIDAIGQGLTDVLSTGKWTDFGNVAKQVLQMITSEFLKLALLNPIKNMLIPGSNAPTLFDLFNNIGGATNTNLAGSPVASGANAIGGVGSSSGGGLSGIGGLLGGIGSAFGKTGIFGSEGGLFGATGFFGSSGWLANTFGSGAGAAGSIGAAADLTAAAPLVGTIGSSVAPVITSELPLLIPGGHMGGVSNMLSTSHSVPAAAFAGAPSYHDGGLLEGQKTIEGLANNELPAILKRGELVLTPEQQQIVVQHMIQSDKRQKPANANSYQQWGALAGKFDEKNYSLPEQPTLAQVLKMAPFERKQQSLPQQPTLAQILKLPRFHDGGLVSPMSTLPRVANDDIVVRRNETALSRAQQRAVEGKADRSNVNRPIVHQTFNIQTPDADSFRASKTQVQTEMARALVAASRRM